jgi:hypothetical protein
MNDVADRLRAASIEFAELRAVVEAGEPWPLSPTYGAEPESAWGPKEVLAHVAEMIPYWTAQIEAIVAGPAEARPIGRVATDPARIARIGADRALPAGELFGRIEAAAVAAAGRLDGLAGEARTRRGVHVRLGEMTVDEIAVRFIVSHLQEHVAQLRSVVEARPG